MTLAGATSGGTLSGAAVYSPIPLAAGDMSIPDLTLIFLHAFGMGAATWQPVRELLSSMPSIAIDLPGFGTAADLG